MPRVVVTAGALRGLERCRRFLVDQDAGAAVRVGVLIQRQLLLLETALEMGRPLGADPELREQVIGFGEAGYVVVYRYVPPEGAVFVLSFRQLRRPAKR